MKNAFISILFLLTLLLLFSCSDDECIPMAVPDCACTAVYDPVCGCDEVTYGNACEAECNSITDYSKGECD